MENVFSFTRQIYRLTAYCFLPTVFWCERGDSNPHTFRYQILSLARLPIPPLSHRFSSYPVLIVPINESSTAINALKEYSSTLTKSYNRLDLAVQLTDEAS